jgi:two-component system chemotaxis sensor kinase CheA
VALPIAKIERITEVEAGSIEGSDAESFTLIDDEPVLVIDVAKRLALDPRARESNFVPLVLTDIRGERVALRVDSFVGQEEIYVKPLPELLAKVPLLAGLTVLGEGSPIFLLDLNHFA